MAEGHLCRVCGVATDEFGSATLLHHVRAEYGRCPACGMVQALDPHWLEEAYGDAIAKLDIGLLDRCQILANVTALVLRSRRLRQGRFLDWAGGYGTLTRLMRDRGFDFVHFDPMAVNIFAEGYDLPALKNHRFDLVTAFEVLEHLPNPVEALAPVAATTDLFLTTTQLLPEPAPRPPDWFYYTPETGQHITFYTPRSLEVLARKLGYHGVCSGWFVHLFYRGTLDPVTKAIIRSPRASHVLGMVASLPDRRHSLLAADLEAARQ